MPRAVIVEPLRVGFYLATDLVFRENIEHGGLDDAFLTHCRHDSRKRHDPLDISTF